jgi:osmotically-inducible protein OsmY
MQQPTDPPRNSSIRILPLVAASFAAATLVIACERADSPLSTRGNDAAQDARQPAVATAPAPSAGTAQDAGERPVAPMPPPDTLTDTMITGRIKTALLSDPGMDGADVSVQTNKGVVTLVGTVESHEQTGIASAHAQRQDGVVRVDSDLTLNAR